jgi:hypothetical protein
LGAPLLLSLSLVLSPICGSSKSCVQREYSTLYAGALWDLDPEDLLPQLCWIGARSVVEHRMCAKLRGAALAELDVVQRGLQHDPEISVVHDYIIHVTAER